MCDSCAGIRPQNVMIVDPIIYLIYSAFSDTQHKVYGTANCVRKQHSILTHIEHILYKPKTYTGYNGWEQLLRIKCFDAANLLDLHDYVGCTQNNQITLTV